MCVLLAMGGEHDKRACPYLAYMLVQFEPVNAAYLDCGACGNNVLKLAESLPDRNHINYTMITKLVCKLQKIVLVTMQIHNVATVRPNRLSPRSEVILNC